MCVATGDVRFAPDSDRESEFSQKAMSALPLKADTCSATSDVGYGPIADIRGREPPMNKEAAAAFSSCEFGSASVVGE
jgi:hypothetical protein